MANQYRGFGEIDEAPAPIALDDLAVAGELGSEAPRPMEFGGHGAGLGEAPAPAPLDMVSEVAAGSEPPAPADLGELGGDIEGATAEEAPPSPMEGPDTETAGFTMAAGVESAPSPMSIEALDAL